MDGAGDRAALNAALHWGQAGMRSIFLQDANSLIIKPERLLAILRHLKSCFPWVERITSYARSHTIARISDEDLRLMAEAGLSRIHIGMESGSDKVLARVHKGVDKKTHILAGQKVKRAGMELSEYIMPGLGGRDLSEEHARESADALNQINPDFIRLRSLAIPDHVELYEEYQRGDFVKLTDVETARELLLFLETLDGITSTLKSDHILNLFEDVEGYTPGIRKEWSALSAVFSTWSRGADALPGRAADGPLSRSRRYGRRRCTRPCRDRLRQGRDHPGQRRCGHRRDDEAFHLTNSGSSEQ